MSIEFLLTTLLIVVSPGVGVIYTLAAGLAHGGRVSLAAALGCTLGIVPHLTAAMLGLAAVMHTSALVFNAVKYAGVVYLLYMAWSMLKGKGALSANSLQRPVAQQAAPSYRRVVGHGILANVLNPKLSVFFLAFLPQFISVQDAYPLWRMAELSGVFMLMTLVVFCAYGIFAAAMRDRVLSRPHVLTWLQRSFAAAFGLLAARLALTER